MMPKRGQAQGTLNVLRGAEGVVDKLEQERRCYAKAQAKASANARLSGIFGEDGYSGSAALSTMKTLLEPAPPAMSTSL